MKTSAIEQLIREYQNGVSAQGLAREAHTELAQLRADLDAAMQQIETMRAVLREIIMDAEEIVDAIAQLHGSLFCNQRVSSSPHPEVTTILRRNEEET